MALTSLTEDRAPTPSLHTSTPHPHTTQVPHTFARHKSPSPSLHPHTTQVFLTLTPHKSPSPSHHTRAPTLTPHKSPHPHTTQEPSPSHHTSKPTFLPGAPLASSRISSSSLSERLRALRAMCLALCLMEWSFGLLPPLLCWVIKQRWISDSRDWEGGGGCVCVHSTDAEAQTIIHLAVLVPALPLLPSCSQTSPFTYKLARYTAHTCICTYHSEGLVLL